ncbi:MAG TPA: GGDEF domain-containing protein [Planctomycetota bacterium]|nr:GGDEF domain-containing protein [Planctomycetota bacterium]
MSSSETPSDQPALSGNYVEIVATLIRSLVHVPGFPQAHGEKLYACLTDLTRVRELEALAGLSKKIDDICSTAMAEVEPSQSFRDQETQLRQIVDTLGESIRSMSAINADTGNRINTQLSQLHQAIIEDGQPLQFGKRIEMIANGIKQTTTILKTELEQSRSQVKAASGKIKNLEKELEQTREESLKDGLTGLNNRRAFNQFIADTLSSYSAAKPWCLIIVDIDHFKRINDTYGHIIGDALLIKLARTLNENVTPPHLLARYGGEEFVMMLPASLAASCEFCENLQKKVRASRWIYRTPGEAEMTISVTVSAGVAVQRPHDIPEVMIARADRALYLAKESGRDCMRSELDVA